MRRFHPLALSFLGVAVFLAIYGGPPGFRDGAHFYGPLFEYLCREAAAGRWPLWNPYENLGQPLAASPTTLFFYPGTWVALGLSVFVGFPPMTSYTVFTGVHLFLGLFTAYRLARHWNAGREAASFAALCYVLGGNVLFQWNNLPFLIGAAWLPEALRQSDRLIRHGHRRNLLGLSVVSSMMILGGDPQAVYHTAIGSLVLLAFRAFDRKTHTVRSIGQMGLRLAMAGILTVLLSGILIIPALELGYHSDRLAETHRHWVYAFSVPPWRLLEFLWPGAGGWQFPVNARWFSAFASERGIWTPSFYMGLVPCSLAVSAIFSRRIYRNRSDRAVLPLLILFVLGSFGSGYFVYPALEYLPGYGMFRYPGKLMTVASLMFAMLAARGYDRLRLDAAFRGRWRTVLCGYAVPIGVVSAMVATGADGFPAVPACPLFGPFDAEKARFGLAFSAICVFLIVLVCQSNRLRIVIPGFLITVTALDLAAANGWMLATLPQPSRLAESPLFAEIESNDTAPARIYRFPVWYPKEFRTVSSPNRLAETADWDRQTLFSRYTLPRYALPLRINVLDVRGTAMAKSYHPLADRLRRELWAGAPGEFERHLARLGVRYVIAPDNARLVADRLFPDLSEPSDVMFWRIREPAPRDFVVYEPNRLVFDVSLDVPKTVVVYEQFWPGWRAFLDGREIPIHAVDDVFRGVNLPAGEHRITMLYDPTSLKLGAAMSLCGLMLLVFLSRRAQNNLP